MKINNQQRYKKELFFHGKRKNESKGTRKDESKSAC